MHNGHIRRDFVRVHRNAHCKHKLFLQGDRLCQLSRFTMLVRRHSSRRPCTLCRRSYTTLALDRQGPDYYSHSVTVWWNTNSFLPLVFIWQLPERYTFCNISVILTV